MSKNELPTSRLLKLIVSQTDRYSGNYIIPLCGWSVIQITSVLCGAADMLVLLSFDFLFIISYCFGTVA